jgi:hypothetical protein
MSLPNVEVLIDELILHGLPPGGERAISAAIEAELGRLLATNGVPPALAAGASIASLDAGSFQARNDAAPEEAGNEIARSVYKGFER